MTQLQYADGAEKNSLGQVSSNRDFIRKEELEDTPPIFRSVQGNVLENMAE